MPAGAAARDREKRMKRRWWASSHLTMMINTNNITNNDINDVKYNINNEQAYRFLGPKGEEVGKEPPHNDNK